MYMKRICFFLVSAFISAQLFTAVGEIEIVLSQPGAHSEYYPKADMPLEVYYDDDTDEIVIVADGFSSYYDVVIEDYYTGVVVISTQISGYGDSIDVSSLSTGTYTITITTSYNNVYVGQFTI